MRNKIGAACMMLGTVLMLAALSLFFWNKYEDEQAGNFVDKILPELVRYVGDQPQRSKEEYPDPYDTEMREVEIDGYKYIGYLSIPSLGLELPVMSEWDYERLRIAPCRYTGSTKTDNLVIAAHNYARHFGGLSSLSQGDEVYFTDMDGRVSRYKVAEGDVLLPEAVEEMTSGEYDLTLFTCTYGGASRITVRCEREDGKER